MRFAQSRHLLRRHSGASNEHTLNDWIQSDPERARQFAPEQLIVAVAERIWEQMEDRGTNKSEIAASLGKSKAYVTQLLNGSRNMTLRSLADIAFVLDAKCEVRFVSKSVGEGWSTAVTNRPATSVVCEVSVQHNAAEAAARLASLPVAA